MIEEIPGIEHYLSILKKERKPKYLEAKEDNTLTKKIEEVENILKSCILCERKCNVDRTSNQLGFCKCDTKARIFGSFAHYGEEPELIPSATLFFAGCTMRCCYCQNAPESIEPKLGIIWDEKEIAEWIEKMEFNGCKNVNFVGGDPTPYLYNILKALSFCKASLPVIWNSNSYYSKFTAEVLKGIVDLYLLDFRYFNNKCAIKFSNAPNYVETAKRNLIEAKNDASLIIRILVIPSHIECCTKPILKWIADNLGCETRINIMDQYWPAFQAYKYKEISRKLKPKEYLEVLEYADELKLRNRVL